MLLEPLPLFIDGARAAARSGERFTSLNPATGQKLCEVDRADAADVDAAVAAARRALPGWSALGGGARGRILRRAAEALRRRKDELARLEVLDTGKPISEALAVDIDSGADCLDYFAGLAAGIAGEHVDLGGQAFFYTKREPLGVCVGHRRLELSPADRVLEVGTGAGLRQHHGLQAVGAHAGDGAGPGRGTRRGRAAGGRVQRRSGRRTHRTGAGPASRCRQGLADRRGRHGQPGHGRCRGDVEARDAGAGRQIATARVRRRRPRQRGRRGDAGKFLHPG